ncbi:unnamed protein product [Parascedosporium putredinis]|uniref:Uncharacterized protein n=1 Tax=Parascedosporium putredinis TaxID=1442378 RepID=A0A9P1MCM4_9PEZI|nr:unnamed protein product [Parascedosporium putredinis]CAI7998087.1 unnamed protein product [Parascedosporium putredinis]
MLTKSLSLGHDGPGPPPLPRLFVNYWLLTEAELDDMATFTTSAAPGCDERDALLAWFWRAEYAVPVPWEDGASLETKRRRFGRFIGLRGCESPLADWEDRSRMDIPGEDALNKAKWYR